MKLKDTIVNYFQRKVNRRTILRITIYLILVGSTIAAIVVGQVFSNQIYSTVGIILLTVIITKIGDNFFLAMRRHSNKLKKLRAMIGS